MPNQRLQKQIFPNIRKSLMGLITLGLLVVPLMACGKKPGQVDAPSGLERDTFPQTYPNPDTDPKP